MPFFGSFCQAQSFLQDSQECNNLKMCDILWGYSFCLKREFWVQNFLLETTFESIISWCWTTFRIIVAHVLTLIRLEIPSRCSTNDPVTFVRVELLGAITARCFWCPTNYNATLLSQIMYSDQSDTGNPLIHWNHYHTLKTHPCKARHGRLEPSALLSRDRNSRWAHDSA